MGFGSGYSIHHNRGGKRYNNDMVAHVWNAQSEEAGQSGNGNFFFRGAALYSYGSHFVVGYIMPDGVAFLNADSYSVSTSGHQSDARGAIKNRRRVLIAGLTDLAGDWKLLPALAASLRDVGTAGTRRNADLQARVRRELASHAVALESPILASGEWGHDSWDYGTTPATRVPFDRSGLTEAGAYLADLAGLPAATWPKIKREAAAARAKAAAAEAKADRKAAEGRALRLSDMSDRDWRGWVARMGTEYSDSALRSTATELRRARKLFMAATRGKLAAAGRLATIRERIKRVQIELERFDAMREPRRNRERLARSIETIRGWRNVPTPVEAVTWNNMNNLAMAAENVSKIGRLPALRESALRLAGLARIGMRAVEAESARRARIEAENREKAQAERVRLWLAGERVGPIRFDAETGGAAMRVMGDVLETSHGASVPLAHAVKAFRFVKLCRERGEEFRRNGRTIRVGPFQVDAIRPDGSFTAGCHDFTWPEIERVAKAAGVFDCEASAEAVTPSHVAA